jgi:hypothetical protein
MPALSEHVNVHSTAIAILRDKGFQVWKTEQYGGSYWAEKDGWDFLAHNPVSLLGLVAIFEARAPKQLREYWWRAENPVSLSDTPNHPTPYVSVIHRQRDDG